MKVAAFGVCVFISAGLSLAPECFAQENDLLRSLAGTWKQSPEKTQRMLPPELVFRTDSSGELEEVRGTEPKPTVIAVRFDGKSANAGEGYTRLHKQTGPNAFERSYTRNGRVVRATRIRMSSDGSSLIEEREVRRPDGEAVITITEYKRSSGEPVKGLVGVWKAASVRDREPRVTRYDAAGPNALRHVGPLGNVWILRFDGKPAEFTGPSAPDNVQVIARQLDSHSYEATWLKDGVAVQRGKTAISSDGKTMTVTTTDLGSNGASTSGTTV